MNEDKATRYHRLRRRSTGLSMMAVAMLLGLVVAANQWAGIQLGATSEKLDEAGAALAAVAWRALVLGGLIEALMLPFGFYRTWLDRRYGLSRESGLRCPVGHLTAALLTLTVAGGAAVLVYAAMRRWPEGWWAVAGLALWVALMAATHLAPVILFPWLYRVRPLDRPALQTRLEALARRAGAPVLSMHQWCLGNQSRRAHAALLGIGPTRRILLSDTLLADCSDDEIEIVFAHELAHYLHGDIWRTVARESAAVTTGCFVASRLLPLVAPHVGLAGAADPAGMPLLVLMVGSTVVLLSPALNAVSRRAERRADRDALAMTGNAGAFVSGLRRLGASNLIEERPSRLVELLWCTHPPLADRIARAVDSRRSSVAGARGWQRAACRRAGDLQTAAASNQLVDVTAHRRPSTGGRVAATRGQARRE